MSENVLALIPARAGSKGIPGKNFKSLAGGRNAVERSIDCALECEIPEIVVSSDCDGASFSWRHHARCSVEQLYRPVELAQDDTPMIDVVKHALEAIPGPEDQIILLVQPTQPLREPKHLRAAITAMQTGEWDSVVSITPIPKTHAPDFVLLYGSTTLCVSPWRGGWKSLPARRQSVPRPYVRDGTAYAFRRSTVAEYDSLYGAVVRGLVIPAEETCPLDTPEDWAEAERRLRAKAEPIARLVQQSRDIWKE